MTDFSSLAPVGRKQLIGDLKKLGIREGETIMLHVSLKAIGFIVGGPDEVIAALLNVISPQGTLLMFVGWSNCTDHLASWPAAAQKIAKDELPAFDLKHSRAHPGHSLLAEYFRTWPDVCRSEHPVASMAALGAKAKELVANHPLQYGYGPLSPLGHLIAAEGKVLLLGAPFSSLTLLHHAEHEVKIPNKRVKHYEVPLLENGQRMWKKVQEFDTSYGIVPGQKNKDYFLLIVQAYLASGQGNEGKVGSALSYLFDAKSLNDFAISWMEKNLSENN